MTTVQMLVVAVAGLVARQQISVNDFKPYAVDVNGFQYRAWTFGGALDKAASVGVTVDAARISCMGRLVDVRFAADVQ